MKDSNGLINMLALFVNYQINMGLGYVINFKHLFLSFALFLISFSSYSASWSYGKITKLESYANSVYVQWDGPNTENCTQQTIIMSATTLGSEAALERSFSIALAAVASNSSALFRLVGCERDRQKAVAVQFCAKDNCAY
ncbi:hypothetical protein R1T43_01315 [Alteromonas sp. CI.11.F.A3]|uniref:hypothetical protein n=1 Tax=Alteromonas sp. CI.11.F.A3 TaxID=3079555 RepID=UPI00294284D8|nr:hypothetical protein [Alteromonas sp. CI.11.F.A3]WOI37705.1 hypothetical protein R1T43_01315 [Alteromonas sp. CI.11.F.A3]